MNQKNAFDRLPEPARTMMKENEKTVGELKSEPPAFGNDVASRISAPTLLVNGANSPRVLHTIASRLAKAITNSEVAKVLGSAHFPHMAKPQEFNTLVLDFLTKQA